jgi:flagellar biosynthesis GTPase FlhF
MHKKNVIITVIWMLVYICFCRYFLSIVKKIWVSNTKQANKQATNETDKTNKQQTRQTRQTSKQTRQTRQTSNKRDRQDKQATNETDKTNKQQTRQTRQTSKQTRQTRQTSKQTRQTSICHHLETFHLLQSLPKFRNLTGCLYKVHDLHP